MDIHFVRDEIKLVQKENVRVQCIVMKMRGTKLESNFRDNWYNCLTYKGIQIIKLIP